MPLPTRRHPVRGTDLDGNSIELVVSIARKLYVCPKCRGSVEIGAEHVVVRRRDKRRDDTDDRYHQHWHTGCAASLARELEISDRKRRR